MAAARRRAFPLVVLRFVCVSMSVCVSACVTVPDFVYFYVSLVFVSIILFIFDNKYGLVFPFLSVYSPLLHYYRALIFELVCLFVCIYTSV